MIKRDELSNPNSCLNRARDDEMVFVLLERDLAASIAILYWAKTRIQLGKNKPEDEQIQNALRCAEYMTKQQLKTK